MKQEEYPVWWPKHPPIYAVEKTYQENLEQGPFFSGAFPERVLPPKEQWSEFLGFPIASRLGVPAGPLLNARWVKFAAQMGFDVVTYKTIRSAFHPAHPLPNMVYVETHGMLSHSRASETLTEAPTPPVSMETLAATNSFGIPSRGREELLGDIAAAQAAMGPGQVLIVSVVGTPREGEDFVDDFAKAAALAVEAGARIVEADLSCPNVATCEGSLFMSPDMVRDLSVKIKKAIGSVPLIIKVGVIENPALLKEVLLAAARAGVRAICGINTMSMKIIKADGSPALGEKRLKAGVCGGPIRDVALDFLKKTRKILREEKIEMALMGTGGVTLPEHFDLFFDAGADVAMSAVGMMWDPYLAMRYHMRERKQNG